MTKHNADRIRTLLRRLKEWEDINDEVDGFAVGTELLLDIQQCLESIMEDPDDII